MASSALPAAAPEAEPVSFSNAVGQRLAGVFTRAPGGGGDCVILCHGYASTRDDMALPDLSQALAAAGVNSLRFDFNGNGASEGALRLAGYGAEVADVAAAKRFLEGTLQQRVVGLLGHSKGGNVVILYAARHGDIPRVVNVAGRFVMSEGIKERFGADIEERLARGPVEVVAALRGGTPLMLTVTQQDLRERMALDIPGACAAINTAGCVRVLTVHGTSDKVIGVKDALAFESALEGSGLVTIDGADHNFTSPNHRRQLVEVAVAFLTAA